MKSVLKWSGSCPFRTTKFEIIHVAIFAGTSTSDSQKQPTQN